MSSASTPPPYKGTNPLAPSNPPSVPTQPGNTRPVSSILPLTSPPSPSRRGRVPRPLAILMIILGVAGFLVVAAVPMGWERARQYEPQSFHEHVQLAWMVMWNGDHAIQRMFLEGGDPRSGVTQVPPVGISKADLLRFMGQPDSEERGSTGDEYLSYAVGDNRHFGGQVGMVEFKTIKGELCYVVFGGFPEVHPKYIARVLAINSSGNAWSVASDDARLVATDGRLGGGGVADAVWERSDERAVAVLSHTPDNRAFLEVYGGSAGSQVAKFLRTRGDTLLDAYLNGYKLGKMNGAPLSGDEVADGTHTSVAEQLAFTQGSRDGAEGRRKRLSITPYILDALNNMARMAYGEYQVQFPNRSRLCPYTAITSEQLATSDELEGAEDSNRFQWSSDYAFMPAGYGPGAVHNPPSAPLIRRQQPTPDAAEAHPAVAPGRNQQSDGEGATPSGYGPGEMYNPSSTPMIRRQPVAPESDSPAAPAPREHTAQPKTISSGASEARREPATSQVSLPTQRAVETPVPRVVSSNDLALAQLAKTPFDAATLAQFRSAIGGETNVERRRDFTMIYYLGCMATQNGSEADKVRAYMDRTYPATDLSGVSIRSLSVACPKCAHGVVKARCADCAGAGTCRQCGGNGISRTRGFDGQAMKCTTCLGSGKCRKCNGTGETEGRCPQCRGAGYVLSSDRIRAAYTGLIKSTQRL